MWKINYSSNEVVFNDQACRLFTEIIKQDDMNRQVLFYIAQCEKMKIAVTVNEIANNVKGINRCAIKDSKKKIVSFSKEEGIIGRKKAEKIIERLAYASLIYFEIQRPYKYIKLTVRGVQVAMELSKQRKKENEK